MCTSTPMIISWFVIQLASSLNNTQPTAKKAADMKKQKGVIELRRLGIIRTTTDVFQVGEHRYTDLKYALEEAERKMASVDQKLLSEPSNQSNEQ